MSLRPLRLMLPILGMLLLGYLGLARLAADAPRDAAAQRDLRHTMLARNALLRDPALAPLNLGVRVHDRVAVLWGPVPSAALKERAAQVLRKLPDLLDVYNDLHVQEPVEVTPPRFLPERLPAAAPAAPNLPGFSRADDAGSSRLTNGPAAVRSFASPAENVRFKPAPADAPPNESGPTTTVLPVITVAVPAAALLPVDEAIAQLKRGDARFQDLRAEVRGNRVWLSGTVARRQDVYDFANAVTRLPGVDRVTFAQVRTTSTDR